MRFSALVAVVVAATFPLSASAADYLVFRNGEKVSNEVWHDFEPVPGVHVPFDSSVKLWVRMNGDNEPSHYEKSIRGVLHVPPQPVVDTKPVPNTQGFYEALAASDVVTDEEFAQALRCQYVKDPAERDAKILKYASGLSPEKLQVLLEAAQKNNIALPLGR